MITIEKTKLDGVVVVTPRRFADSRGFFAESWNRKVFAHAGISYDWVQDNHSLSVVNPTVRGLHCQAPPYAQAKLVRCGRGALYDVAVDVRSGSPTYGQWVGVELSAENGKQLLIPEGFLHGFASLAPDTEILYKCSNIYSAEHERPVRFDDPDLNINWTVDLSGAIVSEKDVAAPAFRDFQSPF